jgi:lipopolysaccharide export LptBFGC system permease protein LptF
MLKDPADMTTIGPVIEKQQKIVNDCVEKKISLSKLQSGIWEKSNNNTESFSMADLDDDIIQNLIDKDVSNDEETYRMR